MEKVIQEFRIIETDDGFRIEIKGDKEQLRDFVMNMDPRRWGPMHHHGGPAGGPPPWMGHGPFRRGRFGPFQFGWGFDAEDEEEAPRRKRGHHHDEADV
jgi:hypothetical protein